MNDPEDQISDLLARIEELEAKNEDLEDESRSDTRSNAAVGYTMGAALAMILSWSRSASILWCIVHGSLSWLYVIYFAFTR